MSAPTPLPGPSPRSTSLPVSSALSSAVDVILPCLDEAGALPWVLTRMPSGYRAIVVDNGSSDDSVAVALAHGATVVHAAQRGFGAACHAGLATATADVVCFMDADASLDPEQLPLVAGPVLAGRRDLVLGRRVPTSRDAWPVHARVGNAVLARRLRHQARLPLHDLGPMRAARRQPLLDLQLVDRRFGYPLEMVIAAARNAWQVEEVAVDYHPRIGRSKVTGTVRGTFRAVRDMRQVMAA